MFWRGRGYPYPCYLDNPSPIFSQRPPVQPPNSFVTRWDLFRNLTKNRFDCPDSRIRSFWLQNPTPPVVNCLTTRSVPSGPQRTSNALNWCSHLQEHSLKIDLYTLFEFLLLLATVDMY